MYQFNYVKAKSLQEAAEQAQLESTANTLVDSMAAHTNPDGSPAFPEFQDGETAPVKVTPGSPVFAGTLNLAQPLLSGLSSTPKLQIAPEPASAWELAQRGAGPDDLICITGSFFLAAELRSQVQ